VLIGEFISSLVPWHPDGQPIYSKASSRSAASKSKHAYYNTSTTLNTTGVVENV
jgi:hypothetical protein